MTLESALDHHYSLRQMQSLLGVSRSVLTALVGAGFISPARGRRNELRFSFRDAVLLRTAYQLQGARIPTRKILSSLAQLQRDLPEEVPLTGLRITAVGGAIAVRDGSVQWEPSTGQMLLDFEVAEVKGGVAFLDNAPATERAAEQQAREWLARGDQIHDAQPAEAEHAYRRAILLRPDDHREAYINLGVLLCGGERCEEALNVFDEAMTRFPDDPLVHFNRGVVLEELARDDEAMLAYAACIAHDARYADAHFNLARMHEHRGEKQAALRHFSAYRRALRS